MDKVFIQGLVQLQCKRFRERGEERREGGIRGREKERQSEEKREKGPTLRLGLALCRCIWVESGNAVCKKVARVEEQGARWAA